jgi:methionyl aminopeptidase
LVNLRTSKEIAALRDANQVVVDVLEALRESAKAGMTTQDLELRARKMLARTKAKPAFLGYRGYPAVLCVSVNDEVVHGIPSEHRTIREGDVVSIDFGAVLHGWVGDAAFTFPIGKVDAQKEKLLRVANECLERAVACMVAGRRLSDIARAVQEHAESNGLSVVYKFVGHGIGKKMHEEPQVPNCGEPNPDLVLRPGMVLALEPMINCGVADVEVLDDGWTAVTADGQPSAHFEKSVAVGKDAPQVLSDWRL